MTIFEKNKFGQKAGDKIKNEFTENQKNELIKILKSTFIKAPQAKKSDKGLSTIYSADSRADQDDTELDPFERDENENWQNTLDFSKTLELISKK